MFAIWRFSGRWGQSMDRRDLDGVWWAVTPGARAFYWLRGRRSPLADRDESAITLTDAVQLPVARARLKHPPVLPSSTGKNGCRR